jgi:hypothetical protein
MLDSSSWVIGPFVGQPASGTKLILAQGSLWRPKHTYTRLSLRTELDPVRTFNGPIWSSAGGRQITRSRPSLKMEGTSIVLALTQDRTGHMAQTRAYNSAPPREQRDVHRLTRLERDQPPGANVVNQWFRVRTWPILARAALESVRSHCISPFSQVPVEARHQAQRIVNDV